MTVAEIKRAKKTGECPSSNKQRQLVRIPSPAERTQIYKQTARALEAKESECMALFGGRPWQVTCRVVEQKPPLFRWFRGELELATLPHFLDKIPDPPKLKGKQEYPEEDYVPATSLQERTISTLSTYAWNDSDYGIPTVTTKWLSPNHDYFYSRKSAWEEMNRLSEEQLFLQKTLLGLGFRGQKLKPFKPTRPQALKAGKVRFQRDGLWVVGQEESWQEERARFLLAEAKRKEQVRQNVSSKCEEVEGSITPMQTLEAATDAANEASNKNVVGNAKKTMVKDTTANVEACDGTETRESKRPLSGLECYLRSERSRYRDEKLAELTNDSTAPAPMTLREAERELRVVWKTLSEAERKEWKARAEQLKEAESTIEPPKQSELSASIEKSGQEAVAEKPNLRLEAINETERTVITQTVESVTVASEQRLTSVTPSEEEIAVDQSRSGVPPKLQPVASYAMHQATVRAETAADSLNLKESSATSSDIELTAKCDAAPSNVQSVAPSVMTVAAGVDGKSFGQKESSLASSDEEMAELLCNEHLPDAATQAEKDSDSPSSSTDGVASMFPPVSPSPPSVPMNDSEKIEEVSSSLLPRDQTHSDSENSRTAKIGKDFDDRNEARSSSLDLGQANQEAELKDGTSTPNGVPRMLPAKRRRSSDSCPPIRITQSTEWMLRPEQIDLCHAAAMEHFETVMNTVKARALHSELQDGFDVLRERGRGRYDMELPIFDDQKFSFLTDIHGAAWMPIVREVLGPEVTLIHKGIFLSMPGAEAQEYHQDGPHLTTKSQRPCHAVNVFIPLVDLHSRNGPTEFCLGTHVLGHDGYDRKRIQTPTVRAGTPVMFDYRLGHRGMANSSSSCRPIVYCTYAASANGKEFRDSVNFSRKRYHKIGALVEKPLSRKERAEKRRKQASEAKVEENSSPLEKQAAKEDAKDNATRDPLAMIE